MLLEYTAAVYTMVLQAYGVTPGNFSASSWRLSMPHPTGAPPSNATIATGSPSLALGAVCFST